SGLDSKGDGLPMTHAAWQGKVLCMSAIGGLLCAAAAGCRQGQAPRWADLVVANAKVWTVDPARPRAEAVAIVGERIAALGTAAEIDAWRGPATKVIDARGRFVMPGFNDAHIHLIEGGMQLDNVDLKDAASFEEFARRIGERAAATPKGEWILGGNWDEQAWTPAVLPAKALIDPVTPDTPVFVGRYDLHMGLANSVALTLAGITAKTPDPPGGAIVRDARGNPTGILKDAAMSYVQRVIPDATPERRQRALKRALEHMAALGVTSVQDMGPAQADVALYASAADTGELTARIRVAPALATWVDLAGRGAVKPFSGAFLRSGAVKAFADGSLGSTTALFFEPYTDAPAARGLLADEMQPLDGMRSRLVQADKAAQQICMHAIGDRAISMTLDLFRDVEAANGPRDRRFRIEHSQHVAPGDFSRYAALNVIASVQPYHAIDDGRWAEKRIGPARIKTTYAFREFLDHKVRLAIGTDWPVAPLDPVLGLHAAVTRATLDGKNPGGWVPAQKITLAEAIEAYTMGAAYAEFQEQDKGSITAGKLADLSILGTDPFAVEPPGLRDLKVDMTIVGGRVVYERKQGRPD
ncbi:MAG: Amidohydrolase 3, partial [Acidobacteria bacterium]|nr:Amidohydrolase 3 [Acidobacteriota bacterium]